MRLNSWVAEGCAQDRPIDSLAIEDLRDKIPGIAAAMTEGRPFFAESRRGNVRGIVRQGRPALQKQVEVTRER